MSGPEHRSMGQYTNYVTSKQQLFADAALHQEREWESALKAELNIIKPTLNKLQ